MRSYERYDKILSTIITILIVLIIGSVITYAYMTDSLFVTPDGLVFGSISLDHEHYKLALTEEIDIESEDEEGIDMEVEYDLLEGDPITISSAEETDEMYIRFKVYMTYQFDTDDTRELDPTDEDEALIQDALDYINANILPESLTKQYTPDPNSEDENDLPYAFTLYEGYFYLTVERGGGDGDTEMFVLTAGKTITFLETFRLFDTDDSPIDMETALEILTEPANSVGDNKINFTFKILCEALQAANAGTTVSEASVSFDEAFSSAS